MPLLDLRLIDFEQFASIIGIIGYLLLIISGQQSRENILKTQAGISTNPSESAQTAALSVWVRLFAIVILTYIAIIRLDEREQQIETGTAAGSIAPNIFITAGSLISVAGFVLIAIGAQERAAGAINS